MHLGIILTPGASFSKLPVISLPGPLSCFVLHSRWQFQKVRKLYSKVISSRSKMDFIRGQNTPHFFGEFDFKLVKLPGHLRNGPQGPVTITKVGSQYINSRARQPNLTTTCMHQWDSHIQDCSTQHGAAFYITVNAIPLSHKQLFGRPT